MKRLPQALYLLITLSSIAVAVAQPASPAPVVQAHEADCIVEQMVQVWTADADGAR